MNQPASYAVLTDEGLPADKITLTGIWGTGYHGLYDYERANGQKYSADVTMYVDASAAAESDAIMQTVSYSEVAAAVHGVLTGPAVDLIETVASRIADVVLIHPAVLAVDVTVHKPEAPVAVPFDDISVTLHRRAVRQLPFRTRVQLWELTPHQSQAVPNKLEHNPQQPVVAVLALGSNLGDSIATLRSAVRALQNHPGLQVIGVSPLAKTAPVGGPANQGDFYNAVVQVSTQLSPRELLEVCHELEDTHGRVREEVWGPRTLDVDLICYSDLVAADVDIQVPHPRAHQRAFVLYPWAQLDPHALLPGVGGGKVAQLAQEAPDLAGVLGLNSTWLSTPPPPPAED